MKCTDIQTTISSRGGVYLPLNNHTMRKSCFGHSINSEYPEQASAFIQASKCY